MLGEGSNLSVSVLGTIAIEAAGLAYRELRFASMSLQRERLWYICSTTAPRSAPSLAEISELLRLCYIRPMSEIIDIGGDSQFLTMLHENRNTALFDLKHCCDCMKKDPVFQPSWDLVGADGLPMRHLFYFCGEDVFVLVKMSSGESKGEIDFIERENDMLSSQRATAAVQKLTNFLLHYLWSEIDRS